MLSSSFEVNPNPLKLFATGLFDVYIIIKCEDNIQINRGVVRREDNEQRPS